VHRFDHRDYVSMTMEFRCNLRCVHCMIEDTMHRLAPEPADKFEELLAQNREHRRWKGLILTGSEITLRRDLPELARRARASGFEHVRIQTHGMHLAERAYCEELVEAGVDEYFVSVAGPDAEQDAARS
jgi:MoaA/NifB/PqqE/SkfB family radical SAM enzyme